MSAHIKHDDPADETSEMRNSVGTSMSNITGRPHHPRRLIIFAGPHKSASSSVQEFFHLYASNHDINRRLPAFDGWTWPWNPKRGGKYQSRKAFAVLVNERQTRPELCQKVYGSILRALKEDPSTSLIVGTEEFDRFGTTPWSHRDGIAAIRDLMALVQRQVREVEADGTKSTSLLCQLDVEIVVNYGQERINGSIFGGN